MIVAVILLVWQIVICKNKVHSKYHVCQIL